VEDYSSDCESGNKEESDEDDVSSLVDNSSFLNSKSKESARVPDIINEMPMANNNTSSVIEFFARIHVVDANFSGVQGAVYSICIY